ncbi:MAG: hypothetical protein ACLRNQ_06560 [Flavonifractor plautii]
MDEQKKTSGSLALNSTPQVITIPPVTQSGIGSCGWRLMPG